MRVPLSTVLETGFLVDIDTFFMFRRIYLRKPGKDYDCSECGIVFTKSTGPKARKYQYSAWSARDKEFKTPSGKFTETWRVCPECVGLWRKIVANVDDLDEVRYAHVPGKLMALGDAVFKAHDEMFGVGKLRSGR